MFERISTFLYGCKISELATFSRNNFYFNPEKIHRKTRFSEEKNQLKRTHIYFFDSIRLLLEDGEKFKLASDVYFNSVLFFLNKWS